MHKAAFNVFSSIFFVQLECKGFGLRPNLSFNSRSGVSLWIRLSLATFLQNNEVLIISYLPFLKLWPPDPQLVVDRLSKSRFPIYRNISDTGGVLCALERSQWVRNRSCGKWNDMSDMGHPKLIIWNIFYKRKVKFLTYKTSFFGQSFKIKWSQIFVLLSNFTMFSYLESELILAFFFFYW